MKKIAMAMIAGCICLLSAVYAVAESYYCVPQDNGKYVCEPAGEIRDYPNGKQVASSFDGFRDKFRCHQEDGKWVCVPFDKGAIILEPEHTCSGSISRWPGNITPL